jgi:hypothetical protein
MTKLELHKVCLFCYFSAESKSFKALLKTCEYKAPFGWRYLAVLATTNVNK